MLSGQVCSASTLLLYFVLWWQVNRSLSRTDWHSLLLSLPLSSSRRANLSRSRRWSECVCVDLRVLFFMKMSPGLCSLYRDVSLEIFIYGQYTKPWCMYHLWFLHFQLSFPAWFVLKLSSHLQPAWPGNWSNDVVVKIKRGEPPGRGGERESAREQRWAAVCYTDYSNPRKRETIHKCFFFNFAHNISEKPYYEEMFSVLWIFFF